MQVRLEVSHKSGKKKTVNIHSDAVIGRSTECSLRIASSEISRKHCRLTVMESGVLVRDLDSANGTWVNGKMIPPDRDVALPPGSRLSVGPVQFVVDYESSDPAIEPPGSTVDLPSMNARSEAAARAAVVAGAAAAGKQPECGERANVGAEVGEPLSAADFQADHDESNAVATVVVDPGAIQQALAESLSDAAAETATFEAEVPELAGPAPGVVETVDEAEADPPAARGKLASMFGGLLGRFGRSKRSSVKEHVAAAAAKGAASEAALDTATTTPEEAEASAADEGEPTGGKDQPVIAPPPDIDAEEAEEGAYADEEGIDQEYDDDYGDEEYDEEAEADADLGDFFRQFEK